MILVSFRHWQSKSIEQKQSTSALMLGLSGATLGFSITLIPKGQYVGCLSSSLFHISAITLLMSLILGVLFSMNRVRDFDLTSQVARKREINPKDLSLKDLRLTLRKWGRITRRLYFAQGVTFIIGSIVFLLFVAIRYAPSLYLSTPT